MLYQQYQIWHQRINCQSQFSSLSRTASQQCEHLRLFLEPFALLCAFSLATVWASLLLSLHCVVCPVPSSCRTCVLWVLCFRRWHLCTTWFSILRRSTRALVWTVFAFCSRCNLLSHFSPSRCECESNQQSSFSFFFLSLSLFYRQLFSCLLTWVLLILEWTLLVS